MPEQAKEVARRIYEAMDRHDTAAFAELLAADVVNHGMQGQGREEAKQEFDYWLTAFPDLEVEIEQLISEGNRVAVRYTGRGTHRGDLGSIPATGKRIEVAQADILLIENGLVVEGWYLPDLYALFQQLGVIGDSFTEAPTEAPAA